MAVLSRVSSQISSEECSGTGPSILVRVRLKACFPRRSGV